MKLAGIHLDSSRLLALSVRLRKCGREDIADWFQIAHDRGIPALALSPSERDAIVDELEGSHGELAELRDELRHRGSP